MPADPPAVRAAAEADPAFATVFSILKAGRNGPSSSLRRIAGGRPPWVPAMPAAEVLRVFEKLAALGVGEMVGRGTRRERFAWHVRAKAVMAAAEGRLAEWHPSHFRKVPASASASAPPVPAGPPALPQEWLRHRLPLEPGREVDLAFPPDLSVEEARWIGDYLARLAGKAARAVREKRSPE